MANSQILVHELRVETEVGAEGDKYRDHERADIPWDPLGRISFFFLSFEFLSDSDQVPHRRSFFFPS